MSTVRRLPHRLAAMVSMLLLASMFLSPFQFPALAQEPEPEHEQQPPTSPEGQPPQPGRAAAFNPFKPLAYRQIGPFRGGRVTAVAGVPTQPLVYYFGATGGGVW